MQNMDKLLLLEGRWRYFEVAWDLGTPVEELGYWQCLKSYKLCSVYAVLYRYCRKPECGHRYE